MDRFYYLKRHVSQFTAKGSQPPQFVEELTDEHKKIKIPNLIYPIEQNVFIHADGLDVSGDSYPKYHVITPDPPKEVLFDTVERMFAKKANEQKPPEDKNDRIKIIQDYLDSICERTDMPVSYDKEDMDKLLRKNKVQVNNND
ncbi:MAG: flagellar protein FlaI, partial [Candidatus Korarchaeota archaeon]|nr:flagellar protein FlaI [Candidatus Korarchaeota archaeon]